MGKIAHIGSRYYEGLVIAEWNSFTGNNAFGPDSVSTAEDHIINRLIAVANTEDPKGTSLVVFIETEVVAIEDEADEGYIELPNVRMYAMPFPEDVRFRKQMLRQIKENCKIDLRIA